MYLYCPAVVLSYGHPPVSRLHQCGNVKLVYQFVDSPPGLTILITTGWITMKFVAS